MRLGWVGNDAFRPIAQLTIASYAVFTSLQLAESAYPKQIQGASFQCPIFQRRDYRQRRDRGDVAQVRHTYLVESAVA